MPDVLISKREYLAVVESHIHNDWRHPLGAFEIGDYKIYITAQSGELWLERRECGGMSFSGKDLVKVLDEFWTEKF